jgi:DNA-binding IscR family transcriptional regulator
LRLAMLDVRNAIADILDQTTLANVSTRVERAQHSDKRPARRTTRSASARKPSQR